MNIHVLCLRGKGGSSNCLLTDSLLEIAFSMERVLFDECFFFDSFSMYNITYSIKICLTPMLFSNLLINLNITKVTISMIQEYH